MCNVGEGCLAPVSSRRFLRLGMACFSFAYSVWLECAIGMAPHRCDLNPWEKARANGLDKTWQPQRISRTQGQHCTRRTTKASEETEV